MACSTTSTAAPRTSARWRENRAAFRRIAFQPRVLPRRRRARPVDDAARPARFRSRSCSRPPASPASPIPRASWRSPAPRRAPGMPVLAVDARHPLDRGGRRRSATAASGSRSTCAATAGSSRRWSSEPPPRDTRRWCSPSTLTVLGRRERDVRRGLQAAAEDRARHAARRRHPPGLDVGTSCAPSPSASPTSPASTSGDGSHRGLAGRLHRRSSSTRASRGADVEWMRSIWDGPIVIKGIQTVADAGSRPTRASRRSRCRTTAAGSSTPRRRSLDLVAPVADAVGDRIEIICDGGVRRGSDIVKAVALGARACMAGRAYLYGLGGGRRARRRPRARAVRRRHPPHHGAHRRPRRRRTSPATSSPSPPPADPTNTNISKFAYRMCTVNFEMFGPGVRQRPGSVPPSTV